MLGRSIFFALAVCGFAAMAVPSSDDEDADKENSHPKGVFGSTQSAPAPSTANAAWFAGEHTIDRQPDGHFYALANVDGANVRMMVDTGASVIALTADDALAAGLQWDESQVRHIGAGASGAVYGVPTRLKEVEIGGMVRRNVQAVIIPEGLGISLLGQSYLSRIGAVEIADNRMVMSAE